MKIIKQTKTYEIITSIILEKDTINYKNIINLLEYGFGEVGEDLILNRYYNLFIDGSKRILWDCVLPQRNISYFAKEEVVILLEKLYQQQIRKDKFKILLDEN